MFLRVLLQIVSIFLWAAVALGCVVTVAAVFMPMSPTVTTPVLTRVIVVALFGLPSALLALRLLKADPWDRRTPRRRPDPKETGFAWWEVPESGDMTDRRLNDLLVEQGLEPLPGVGEDEDDAGRSGSRQGAPGSDRGGPTIDEGGADSHTRPGNERFAPDDDPPDANPSPSRGTDA